MTRLAASPQSHEKPYDPPFFPASAPVPVRSGGVRVLVIDPDPEASGRLASLLTAHGYDVATLPSVEAAEPRIAAGPPDLILLETALPGEDGLSFCRRLSRREAPPVMVVGARCEALDRVLALEFGAEDCLPKDGHPLELLARMKVILRRRPRPPVIAGREEAPAGAWALDEASRALAGPGGTSVRLSPAEFALMGAFLGRPGEVLTRDDLRRACGGDPPLSGRAVDAMVCRLRRKLREQTGEHLIESIRGLGYSLSPLGARTGRRPQTCRGSSQTPDGSPAP